MVSVLDAREDIPFQSDDGWEKNKQNQDLGVEKKKQGFSISFTLKHSLWLKNNKEDFWQ